MATFKKNTPMKTNAINWFEIFTTDFNRAKAFYANILQRPLPEIESSCGVKMALFSEGGEKGTGGALTKMDNCNPGPGGTVVYLDVEGDLDGVLGRVPAAGGKVVQERMAIPPHGFIGLIEDTEGNIVGLHSMA
jgi:predicted enzyme related to lactoylglutathione lyase